MITDSTVIDRITQTFDWSGSTLQIQTWDGPVLLDRFVVTNARNYRVPSALQLLAQTRLAEVISTGVRAVTLSRNLVPSDNGLILDCSPGVTLTIPKDLFNFGCAVRPAGVVVTPASGVELNDATASVTTVQRLSALSPTSVADKYDLVGV